MADREMSYRSGVSDRSGGNGADVDTMEAAERRTSEYREKSQEKVSEFGQRTQQQAEAARERAAGSLDRAATQLRERAEHQGGKTAEIGVKVADKLDSTSDYLEQHDTTEIVDDVQKYIRQHPLQAVGAAVVGGFVLARILR